MNLRWTTLRRSSPAAAIMLMVGGLFLVSTSQAPRTQDASFDVPTMFLLPTNPSSVTPATAATTTATDATTTTTAPAPIVYDAIPPGGRQNLGGDTHPMEAHPAFGMMVIPKINLVHPIFEGIDETAIHWGPGHWPGSASPGQLGNAVFAGHRVTHTRPFLDIDLLTPGDQIIFHLASGTYTYEVTEHVIVFPQDTWIANPTPDATVTIFGCHPKHSARQRYVVRGKLVSSGPYSPV
ncbi:MAG: sortase [Actinomycetota bacterium]|jgi:sortase A|nr:sortase [Actinomycetota bacterium]MDQ1497414.1 sortase [Actinomycetota bacterium]MDQ1507906.1 sortase [Actinomycetota bacterium]